VRSLSEEVEALEDNSSTASIRQLIINTHSPLVVAELRDDELLFAETLKIKNRAFVNFKPLTSTWRQTISNAKGAELITRGEILSYLSGHKHSARTVGHTDLVGRLAIIPAEETQRPRTPDLFQQAMP